MTKNDVQAFKQNVDKFFSVPNHTEQEYNDALKYICDSIAVVADEVLAQKARKK